MSFFRNFGERLRQSLDRTQRSLKEGLDSLLGGGRLDPALLEDLEALLIGADLGVHTARGFIERLTAEARRNGGLTASEVGLALAGHLTEALKGSGAALDLSARPTVILLLGVNGSGKTTTAAKLAHLLKADGRQVLLAAADTFRAAAIEQLQLWGGRIGVDVIAQKAGADPSAVAFDAVKAAQARGSDVLIVDTAGRLQTKVNLMAELARITRVIGRQCPGAPHETLMVIEAPTGQNGISQARLFHEAVGLSGMILTKLDGTAKGGIVVRIFQELQLPIKFVGTGEQVDDLQPFDPEAFVSALMARS
jgi:fused signal recognition particle receptor